MVSEMTKNEILNLMNETWIYEAIITTTDACGTIRAAPMGISTPDSEHMVLEIYKTSKTAGNIIRDKKFTINFVMYVELFWNSIKGKNLEYDSFGHLKDSDAWIDAKVQEIESSGEKIKVYSKITVYGIKNPNFVLINRAKHLAFESVVLFTKPGDEAKNEINENLRVIKKVAPGSKYEKLVKEILKEIKNAREPMKNI